MDYISHTSGRPFGRRNNVVDLEPKRAQSKRTRTRHLVTVAALAGIAGASAPFALQNIHSAEFAPWHSSEPFSTATAYVPRSIPICTGRNRKARKVTCLVDGDTGWENGVKWRLYSIDTPELGNPACSNERSKAIAARDRLRSLMGSGYRLEWLGSSGSYGRKLVRIKLADGRYAGKALLQEGLAQPWPNSGNIWCQS